jgi:hypothetical protein
MSKEETINVENKLVLKPPFESIIDKFSEKNIEKANDNNNNHTNGFSNEVINLTNGKNGVYKLSHEDLAKRAASPLQDQKRLHRVVFTGGPCAGKTTAINRIKNFFENIGWKVGILDFFFSQVSQNSIDF